MPCPISTSGLVNIRSKFHCVGISFPVEYFLISFAFSDLAARNCLLTEDLVLKIADFGMAREEHVYEVGCPLDSIYLLHLPPNLPHLVKAELPFFQQCVTHLLTPNKVLVNQLGLNNILRISRLTRFLLFVILS